MLSIRSADSLDFPNPRFLQITPVFPLSILHQSNSQYLRLSCLLHILFHLMRHFAMQYSCQARCPSEHTVCLSHRCTELPKPQSNIKAFLSKSFLQCIGCLYGARCINCFSHILRFTCVPVRSEQTVIRLYSSAMHQGALTFVISSRELDNGWHKQCTMTIMVDCLFQRPRGAQIRHFEKTFQVYQLLTFNGQQLINASTISIRRGQRQVYTSFFRNFNNPKSPLATNQAGKAHVNSFYGFCCLCI